MAKKIRAKDEIMGELHLALAQQLLDKVKSGEATAQEINAAIKFLHNNGIQGEVDVAGPVKSLVDILPQFTDEDA